MSDVLEYEVVKGGDADRPFTVWTPDRSVGACIGGGKTPVEALTDARRSMEATAVKIAQDIALGNY